TVNGLTADNGSFHLHSLWTICLAERIIRRTPLPRKRKIRQVRIYPTCIGFRLSFVAESAHRIDLRGPLRWKESRCCGNKSQDNHRRGYDQNVISFDFIKERLRQPAQTDRAAEADNCSNDSHQSDLS